MAIDDKQQQKRIARRNTVDAIDDQRASVVNIAGEPYAVPHKVIDWMLSALEAERPQAPENKVAADPRTAAAALWEMGIK